MIRSAARRLLAATLCLGLLSVLPADAQSLLDEFEDRVTEFTLDNGLHFIVIERHQAPVVSFVTYANVGGVDEQVGETGLAHMFEHMAFKGTTSLGTTDIEAELDAIEQEEEVYQRLLRERLKANPDEELIEQLEEEFEQAKEAANAFVDQNAFDRVLQKAGMTGLNATTSSDATRYFYSLPSNKAELFFALESDRFLNPVQREFYQERDVVMEERRMRTDSSPFGRLMEEFLATAFKAHPYGSPVIGHMSDLETISRSDAEAFFDTYYNPSNLTIAIAGDIYPDEARQLAERYFGALPAGEEPLPVSTVEPEQNAARRVVIEDASQPYLMMGYHRPSVRSEDDVVYDVLADVLSRGRTSRFHRKLTETQLALQAQAISAFPGSKYPSLFTIYALPGRGVTADSLAGEIVAELDRIKEEGITAEELERAKTRARANLIGGLDNNMGLALRLATMEVITGDWRTLFTQLDRIEALTVEDVRRVAQDTFVESNRTIGYTVQPGSDAPSTAEVAN